jgi:hypothetical protein
MHVGERVTDHNGAAATIMYAYPDGLFVDVDYDEPQLRVSRHTGREYTTTCSCIHKALLTPAGALF